MIFSDKYNVFVFADFYLALNSEFIDGLMNAGGDAGVVLYFLEPSPEDYFVLAGKYAIFDFSRHDISKDVVSVLNEPAGGRAGVALASCYFRFVYYSRDHEWVVFCDRDFEICILAAVNQEVAKRLCNSLSAAYRGSEVCSTLDEFLSEPWYELDEASKAAISANYASADGA